MALQQILAKVEERRKVLWQQYPELPQRVEALQAEREKKLPEWLEQAKANLTVKGCQVVTAATPEDAFAYIRRLAGDGPAVQAYSPLLQQIGLPGWLRQLGIQVTETHLGALAVDLLGLNPAHPDFPAGELEEKEILRALEQYTGIDAHAPKEMILKAVQKLLRQEAERAQLGISGVSAIIAEHGSLVLGEDQGHLRLVSNLPPVHVAVVSPGQIVPTLEDAVRLLRYQAINGYGRDIQTYLSIISGPSRTADIEFKMVKGVHGPRELHVVFLLY